MLDLLWAVAALPLAGFAVLFATGGRLPNGAVTTVALSATGLSAAIAMLIAIQFFAAPPPDGVLRQAIGPWISVAAFRPEFALRLDALSLLMMLVITFVGFLIHLYSAEFMAEDPGYSRFFAYMNLFVASMLLLKRPASEIQKEAYLKKDRENLATWPQKMTPVTIEPEAMAEFRKIGGEPLWKEWVRENQGDFDAQGLLDLVLNTAEEACKKYCD